MEGEEWRESVDRSRGKMQEERADREVEMRRAILCPTRCYIYITPIHTRHIKCVALCTCYTDIAHQTTHLSSQHIFPLTLNGGTPTWSEWLDWL